MTFRLRKKQHHTTSLAKNKRSRAEHLRRLQLYAVITGVVGLLMTLIRLVISLIH